MQAAYLKRLIERMEADATQSEPRLITIQQASEITGIPARVLRDHKQHYGFASRHEKGRRLYAVRSEFDAVVLRDQAVAAPRSVDDAKKPRRPQRKDGLMEIRGEKAA